MITRRDFLKLTAQATAILTTTVALPGEALSFSLDEEKPKPIKVPVDLSKYEPGDFFAIDYAEFSNADAEKMKHMIKSAAHAFARAAERHNVVIIGRVKYQCLPRVAGEFGIPENWETVWAHVWEATMLVPKDAS